MNKVITAISLITIILLLCVAGLFETYYTREGEVVKVEGTLVTVEDKTERWWSFYGDGYKVGEKVTLVMNSMHTDITTDDEVIKVRG
jgi:hypothetical protein